MRWDFGGYRDRIFLEPLCCRLPPLDFDAQLKQSFGLSLSIREVAALCHELDVNHDYLVNGSEFLRGFFRMQAEAEADMSVAMERSNERRRAKFASPYTGLQHLGR